MRRLYHIPLSPFCRKVRVALAEKGLGFELRTELPWDRRPEFLALNPAGEVPLLVEEDERIVIPDSQAICEYLDEAYPDRRLMGFDPVIARRNPAADRLVRSEIPARGHHLYSV